MLEKDFEQLHAFGNSVMAFEYPELDPINLLLVLDPAGFEPYRFSLNRFYYHNNKLG